MDDGFRASPDESACANSRRELSAPSSLPVPPAPASGRTPPRLREASVLAPAGGRHGSGWQPPPSRTLSLILAILVGGQASRGCVDSGAGPARCLLRVRISRGGSDAPTRSASCLDSFVRYLPRRPPAQRRMGAKSLWNPINSPIGSRAANPSVSSCK